MGRTNLILTNPFTDWVEWKRDGARIVYLQIG